jgi:hypothetical protein
MFAKLTPYVGVAAVWLTTFVILLFGGFGSDSSWDLLGILAIAAACFTTAVVFHWSRAGRTRESSRR